MKILVVDDEPWARQRLRRMLGEIDPTFSVGEAGDASNALQAIRREQQDLVLLDIRMPGISGLELAASAPDLPPIVFTTAYDQYAVRAFEVEAVDYLLKPISAARLSEAVEKARVRRGGPDAARLQALLAGVEGRLRSASPRLHARSGSTTRLFDAATVTRIFAKDGYSALRFEGREYLLDDGLSRLEAVLADVGFFRVHRGELVNLACVRALHTRDGVLMLELSDGQTASVSRRNTSALKRRLSIR